MKNKKHFFLILLVMLITSATIHAEQKKSITVMNFNSRGVEQFVTDQVAIAFSATLVNLNMFRVLERSQMEAILQEQAFQQSGACDTEACFVEVGQLLGVGLMIFGDLGKLDDDYTINVKLLDVNTAQIIKQHYFIHEGSLSNMIRHKIPEIANFLFEIEAEVEEVPEEEFKEIVEEVKEEEENQVKETTSIETDKTEVKPTTSTPVKEKTGINKKKLAFQIVSFGLAAGGLAFAMIKNTHADEIYTGGYAGGGDMDGDDMRNVLIANNVDINDQAATEKYFEQQGDELDRAILERNIGIGVSIFGAVAGLSVTFFF